MEMLFPGVEELSRYLTEIFGSEVEVDCFGELGEKGIAKEELKAFGYGIPYLVAFSVKGEKREAIISTMKIGKGFSHDYRSDRAQSLLLSHDTWNDLPKHAKIYDFGALTKDGRIISLGNTDEFLLLREMVEGEEYHKDLDRIFETGELSHLDRERALALSSYLVGIHSSKRDDPELYVRKIRDTVGHGECVFGLADSYPEKPDFLVEGELEEIEKKCVEHRWRLRGKIHRLSQVHGDFHPWNVLFRDGTDFVLLDRSRGEYGEPADDLAAMSINYLFYSLRKYGCLDGEFEELYNLFIKSYLDETRDHEILEAMPLFYAFRCLVIASPLWYPNLKKETRRKIFNFTQNVLGEARFDPAKANEYME